MKCGFGNKDRLPLEKQKTEPENYRLIHTAPLRLRVGCCASIPTINGGFGEILFNFTTIGEALELFDEIELKRQGTTALTKNSSIPPIRAQQIMIK